MFSMNIESPVTVRSANLGQRVEDKDGLLSISEALVGQEFQTCLQVETPAGKQKIIFVNAAEFAAFAIEMLNAANFNAVCENPVFQDMLPKLKNLAVAPC